jgi:hypothetical protein
MTAGCGALIILAQLANAQTEDSSLGAKLAVTCNTTSIVAAASAGFGVSARVAATSFTLTVAVTPVTNPECFSYFIIN